MWSLISISHTKRKSLAFSDFSPFVQIPQAIVPKLPINRAFFLHIQHQVTTPTDNAKKISTFVRLLFCLHGVITWKCEGRKGRQQLRLSFSTVHDQSTNPIIKCVHLTLNKRTDDHQVDWLPTNNRKRRRSWSHKRQNGQRKQMRIEMNSKGTLACLFSHWNCPL